MVATATRRRPPPGNCTPTRQDQLLSGYLEGRNPEN